MTRPDGLGCGKPMGLSGHIHCYCGQVGVPLCRECKAWKEMTADAERAADEGKSVDYDDLPEGWL
jgi:hypothetical protein